MSLDNTSDNASDYRYRPYSVSRNTSKKTSTIALTPSLSNTTMEISSVSSSTSSKSSSPYNKKLGLTPDVVESAKKSLLDFIEIEESTEEKSNEIVVKENVSLDTFLKYRKKESRLPVHLYLRDGKIIINELPTETHGMVSATIKGEFYNWNHQDLEYGDDTTMILN